MNNLVTDVIVKMVMSLILSAVPFLGFPGLGLIVTLIVTKIVGLAIQVISQFINFEIIDWKVDAQNAAYQRAVAELKAAQAKGDASAIEKAKADFKSTLSSLIHFNS